MPSLFTQGTRTKKHSPNESKVRCVGKHREIDDCGYSILSLTFPGDVYRRLVVVAAVSAGGTVV